MEILGDLSWIVEIIGNVGAMCQHEFMIMFVFVGLRNAIK